MIRIILGVIGGFVAWSIAWFGGEAILSAVWPTFGVNQAAFQSAIERADAAGFAADTSFLLTHIILASIVSLIAGFLSALIAGENKRAPFVLGVLLLAMGLLKALMSWPLVPVWYHILFAAILLPMAIVGGKLKTKNASATANS